MRRDRCLIISQHSVNTRLLFLVPLYVWLEFLWCRLSSFWWFLFGEESGSWGLERPLQKRRRQSNPRVARQGSDSTSSRRQANKCHYPARSLSCTRMTIQHRSLFLVHSHTARHCLSSVHSTVAFALSVTLARGPWYYFRTERCLLEGGLATLGSCFGK